MESRKSYEQDILFFSCLILGKWRTILNNKTIIQQELSER